MLFPRKVDIPSLEKLSNVKCYSIKKIKAGKNVPEISSLRSKDPNFKSTLSNSEQFVTIYAKLPTHLIMVYCSKLLLFLEFKDFFGFTKTLSELSWSPLMSFHILSN